jgi:carbonic anhydrase
MRAGDINTTNHLSVLNGAGNASYVKATPAQFHFHTTSEHLLSGEALP